MSFMFCSECMLRVITNYHPVKWAVWALTDGSCARCRCGHWAEFGVEAIT